MVLIYWVSAIFPLVICVGAKALSRQEPEGCPKLNLANLPPILNGCYDQSGLEKCVQKIFDNQYSFCRTCLIVDKKNLDDTNNCLCVQCAMKALASDCHAKNCDSGPGGSAKGSKEPDFINQIIRGFDTDSVTHFEFDSTVTDSEVSYFADATGRVFRNLLEGEKRALVHSIVEELKQFDAQADGSVNILGFLKKKKTSPPLLPPNPISTPPPATATSPWPPKGYPVPKDEYDDDDDDNDDAGEWKKPSPNPPLVYTKTKLYTTYTPKKKTLTRWNPKTISTTIVIDQCSDKRTTIAVVATETDTEYETIYKPIYKLKTITQFDTVWSGTTTKFKHAMATETETDYELVTKTKYKIDVTTETETEVEEITKYIKVGKVTETDWEVKWKTQTITAGTPSITTATATRTTTQISIVTNHDRTRTKVRTKTMTRTKKIWNPRYTTTQHVSLGVGVLGSNENAQDTEDAFGMFRVNDDPAPLLASKRVIKVHHGNSSNYSTSTIFVSSPPTSFVESKSTSTDGIIIGVSSAPQATTAMLVYTTLAVSLATSMMLAFSYHTNISLADGSDESAEYPSSDDENDDWSDAEEVELTNSEIQSLTVQVPHSGLAPEEMAQKLGEENPIIF